MRILISRHLENFLVLYDAGSMHEAARRKRISQPALTKSLKLLEAEAGAELFVRTHRGIEPTLAGKALHRHALVIDQEARFASMNLAHLHHNLGSTLRIGVGPVLAVSSFPQALALFREEFTKLRIDIETGISEYLIDRLEQDRLDVAVTARPKGDLPESLSFKPLLHSPMVAIARCGHPLSYEERISLNTLTRYGRVGFTDDFEFSDWAKTTLTTHPNEIEAVLQTTSISVMFAILASTDHYAIVSSMILSRAKQDGLQLLPLSDPLWSLDIGVICKATLVTSKPVVALQRIFAQQATSQT
ncbi:LysR family transcriptional regulator [Vreelandella sp. EE27]